MKQNSHQDYLRMIVAMHVREKKEREERVREERGGG